MTDDTLREECRALADIIPALFRDEFYKEKTVDMLLTFARAQQGKQGQEALKLLRELVDADPMYSDAEEGTFCVHCYARWDYIKAVTRHSPNCVWQRAEALLDGNKQKKG
jgi:hypothetical protein